MATELNTCDMGWEPQLFWIPCLVGGEDRQTSCDMERFDLLGVDRDSCGVAMQNHRELVLKSTGDGCIYGSDMRLA